MMKTVAAVLVVVAISFVSSVAYAEEISISVKGMVCSFCAQGIKKTFGRKEGVEQVEVDLDKKTVAITTRKGASLSDEEIKESIVDAGFEVVKIERVS